MKLTYDPRYNIAYIRLLEKKAQVETIQVSDELNIDIAPDGRVYGIELLNCARRTVVVSSFATKRKVKNRPCPWPLLER
jgi:uncharacterized protein YuzE